jgi:hypothetical protein
VIYPWHIRPATGDDRAYIVMTWRSSLRSTREHASKGQPEFRRDVDAHIDRILARSDTRALVAAPNRADEQTIAGWIVYTPIVDRSVLHYLYVRRAARHTGCAKRLLDVAGLLGKPLVYTFRGPQLADIIAKAPSSFYVNPSAFT